MVRPCLLVHHVSLDFKMSNTTGATSEPETPYSQGANQFALVCFGFPCTVSC